MDKIIYTNYKLSLKQKYNAVCFDIDGTLTQKNSKKIDIRAINIILNLLKNKIPVVFITGRGETGLNDLKNDIYNSIKNTHNITKEDIKRIYALTNDGARLFFSNDITIDSFLSSNVYISTNNELEQLNMVNDIVKQIRSKHFDITYSKDTKTNTIINIRLVFNTNAEENIDDIYVKLVDTIAANNFKDIHITRGIYKGTSVIQIGTATKDIAIKRVEKIIGIPEKIL